MTMNFPFVNATSNSCVECGKGFYRKDHLRKHTRSHIARRLKAGKDEAFLDSLLKVLTKCFAELSQQPSNQNGSPSQNPQEQDAHQQAQLLQQIQGHGNHQQNNC
jgi:Zinc finger, C2H2 type